MTEKTFEQELKEVQERKKSNLKIKSFTFVDVPVHIVNFFCSDVKENYGNIYWVKLMDLLRKAEAYDYIISGQNMPELPVEEEKKQDEEEDKDKYGVQTMGGFIPTTKRKGE